MFWAEDARVRWSKTKRYKLSSSRQASCAIRQRIRPGGREMRILLVEDDADLGDAIQRSRHERKGYARSCSASSCTSSCRSTQIPAATIRARARCAGSASFCWGGGRRTPGATSSGSKASRARRSRIGGTRIVWSAREGAGTASSEIPRFRSTDGHDGPGQMPATPWRRGRRHRGDRRPRQATASAGRGSVRR